MKRIRALLLAGMVLALLTWLWCSEGQAGYSTETKVVVSLAAPERVIAGEVFPVLGTINLSNYSGSGPKPIAKWHFIIGDCELVEGQLSEERHTRTSPWYLRSN